ncbi:hypothetical protein EDI_334670 [Entamoeba dispar SAW760]|uniref:Uncharacterized protein n=1 Tax=Entamoeba dispar (strain ATCC PRA-260 / SAW760) TaxID=370354 RepID=B0EUL2_ENTDS|nr:uncharacterized protein EDI_334670 [Entamoeba dispar SAW760]EDR21788.1 hypothetical protein EDI_334670 [Entamoeba dispar SAW760]|eukprot:EDR21788.1 hypothetical protein EDI_334670 [Entamoeba dispar SAW760]
MCEFPPFISDSFFFSQMTSFMNSVERSVSPSNKFVHSDIVTQLNKPFVIINIGSPKPHTFLFPGVTLFDTAVDVISKYYKAKGTLFFHSIPLSNCSLTLNQMYILPSDRFEFRTENNSTFSKEINEFSNEYGISPQKVQKYIDKGIITESMLISKESSNNEKLLADKSLKRFKENPFLLPEINNIDYIKQSFPNYVNAMLRYVYDGIKIDQYLYTVRFIPVLFRDTKQNVFDYINVDNILTLPGCLIVLPTLIECLNTSKKLDDKAYFINRELVSTLCETLNFVISNSSTSEVEILQISLYSLLIYVISLLLNFQIPTIYSSSSVYFSTPLSLLFTPDNYLNIYKCLDSPQPREMQDSSYCYLIRTHQPQEQIAKILTHLESPILRILLLEDNPIYNIQSYLPSIKSEIDKIDYCSGFCFFQPNSTIVSSFLYAFMSTELITNKPEGSIQLVSEGLKELQQTLNNNPIQIISVGYFSSLFKQLQTKEYELDDVEEPKTNSALNLISCLELFLEWVRGTKYISNFALYSSLNPSTHLIPEKSQIKYALLVHQNTSFSSFIEREIIPKDYFIVGVMPNISEEFPLQFTNDGCKYQLNSGIFGEGDTYRAVIRKNGQYIVCENNLQVKVSELELKLALSGMSSFTPRILIYRKLPLFNIPRFPYPLSYIPLMKEVTINQGDIYLLRDMEQCYKNVNKQDAYRYLKKRLLNEINPFEYLDNIDWCADDAKLFRKFLREATIKNPKNALPLFKLKLLQTNNPEVLNDITDIAASSIPKLSYQCIGSELLESILSIPSSKSFERSESIIPFTRFLRVFLPYTLVNREEGNPFRHPNPIEINSIDLNINVLKMMLLRDEKDASVILNYLSWNNTMWTENILSMLETEILDVFNSSVYIHYAWEMFGLEDNLKSKRVEWLKKKIQGFEINCFEIAGIIVEVVGGNKDVLQNCRSIILKELLNKCPSANKLKQMNYKMMIENKDSKEFNDFKDTRIFKTLIKCLGMINKMEQDFQSPVCLERSINKMACVQLQAIQLNKQINNKE